MAIHDFNAQRLYVQAPLAQGARITCDDAQANYLRNVLRLAAGDLLLVFNGRDGEWLAAVAPVGKRGAELEIGEQKRLQEGGPDIRFLFAPLKRARLDYLVQKATEMGAARIEPVLTRRTIAERVNVERLASNVIEAAEQCGILRVPSVAEPVKLERLVKDWDASRRLIFCDESATVADPIAAIRSACQDLLSPSVAVLIGPEGGFDPEERALLLAQPYTLVISLGPRIMRADTAAVAALAVVNAAVGDWR